MVVTAKELRLKTSECLRKVQRIGSITVTLRGKPVAKLVAWPGENISSPGQDPAIGMWADRRDMKDVEAWVRNLRKPRYLP